MFLSYVRHFVLSTGLCPIYGILSLSYYEKLAIIGIDNIIALWTTILHWSSMFNVYWGFLDIIHTQQPWTNQNILLVLRDPCFC